MKKFLTTAAAVFALVAVSNAQLFVGGHVGVSSSSETGKVINADDKIEKVKVDGATMSIQFCPKVGFQLNDEMSVGASLILVTSTTKGFDKDNKVNGKAVLNTVGIAPFFRYSFVEFGDFKVSADASLPFTLSSGKTEFKNDGKTVTAKLPKTMGVGLNVVPVVSYSISDNIDLEAQIDVFGLGINYTSETPFPEGEGKAKDIRENQTKFNLGISPDNVLTSGAIKVGMIFKF